MLPSDRTVDLAPLTLRAAVSSVNDDARTAELIFSTGAPVERYDWRADTRYRERLSLTPAHVRLDRLNNGAPLLDAHAAHTVANQIGVVVEHSAALTTKDARATVRFSERAEVEPIWQDVRTGIVRNVSVGYRVHRCEETAGTDGALPTRLATDWEPFELSLVPMGADPGARVRQTDLFDETNPCVIVTRAAKESAMPIPKNISDTSPADAGQARSAADAERTRAAAIRTAVRAGGLEETVADTLINQGVTADAARATILDTLATRQAQTDTRTGDGRVQLGDDARDQFVRAGQAIRGLDRMQLAERMLTVRSGASQTTSDFAVLLETVLHKILRAEYALQADTWHAGRAARPGAGHDGAGRARHCGGAREYPPRPRGHRGPERRGGPGAARRPGGRDGGGRGRRRDSPHALSRRRGGPRAVCLQRGRPPVWRRGRRSARGQARRHQRESPTTPRRDLPRRARRRHPASVTMSDLDARIDLALTDGTWTPIPDVVGSAGVTLAYGIRGTGPLARTAAPARLTFALHNDAGSAVGVQGAYAPGHANVRAGFGVGTPVRLVLIRAGTAYVKFGGRLTAIQPDPGRGRQQTTCEAADWLETVATTPVRVPAQVDHRADELLETIVNALPADARPVTTDFDQGVSTFPYALYDLDAEEPALRAIAKVVQSELGFCARRRDAGGADRRRRRRPRHHPRAGHDAPDCRGGGRGPAGRARRRPVADRAGGDAHAHPRRPY